MPAPGSRRWKATEGQKSLPLFQSPGFDDGFAAGSHLADFVRDDAALGDGGFLQPPLEER